MTLIRASLVFLAMLTGPAWGATYYVGKSGSDANSPATAQNPAAGSRKLTIANAVLACMAPGDTLVIGDGVYDECINDIVPTGFDWSRPTTVRAEHPRKAILRPSSGSFVMSASGKNQHHIIWDGVVFDGVNITYNVVKIQGNPTIGYAHHIRLLNCEIANIRVNLHSGLLLASQIDAAPNDGGYNEILNCDIHDNGNGNSANVYVTNHDNLIQGCRIYNAAFCGITINKQNAAFPDDNNVRNNRFFGNRGQALIINAGNRNLVYNNLFYDNARNVVGGSAIFVTDTGGDDNKIFNNTICNNQDWGIQIKTGNNNLVKNNIVFGNGSGAIANGGSGTLLSNNVITDPIFVDAANKDFRIQFSSPARDAGANLSAFGSSADFIGVSRPQGPAWDIGAYEFVSAASPAPAPAPVTAPTPTPTPPVPSTNGTTYYTATTGNDGNTGVANQPFRTIQRALSQMRSGDALIIRGGIYQESINSTVPNGTSWTNATRIMSYPGERAILQPVSGTVRVIYLSNTSSYISIEGITIDGTNVGYDGVKVDVNAHHIRFLNCEIKNARTQGALVVNAAFVEFVKCSVHDNGVDDFCHGIYLNGPDGLVDGCDIYRNSGWGVHGYGSESNRVTIRNNKVHDNARVGNRGPGIGLYTGSGHRAYNNVVWGNREGIGIGEGASGSQVHNNTVYGNSRAGIFVDPWGTDTEVINNIVYSNAGGVWDQGIGTIQRNNLIDADPRFVSSNGLDFRLLNGSPAINAGTASALASADILGIARPQGGAWDIGAYEFVPTTPTPAPQPAQTPFNGAPMAVPGTIATAKYDNGGEGVAFHDTDNVNQMSGTWRPGAGVDSNGSGIGWIYAAEWLEYTVTVAASGTYALSIPVCHQGVGGTMHVEFNGVNATGALTVPNTGSWSAFQNIARSVTLSAGTQVMRVAFDTADSAGYGPGIGDIVISSGSGGAGAAIPGTITMSNYDSGGEGVAYHDLDAENRMSSTFRPGHGVDADVSEGIGWIQAGEWVEYTVNVGGGGNYALSVPVCHPGAGGRFHIAFNGVNKTGTLTVPDTGSWEVERSLTATVNLSAGVQTMRIIFDASGSSGYVCGLGVSMVFTPTGNG